MAYLLTYIKTLKCNVVYIFPELKKKERGKNPHII